MSDEKNTAIYLRVSTKQQDHKSQLPDLKRWAESQDKPVKWYRDKCTGRTMKRPGMDQLMNDLRAGKLERIVIWRLDRLGRTAIELLHLCEELRERKVDLVSIRDGLMSLDSAAGRMFFGMLANFAQFETEVRAERVRAGQAAARARGVKWGGSEPGWYFKVTPDQVKAITKMIRDGVKISKIARITGLSRPTIYRVMRNEELSR